MHSDLKLVFSIKFLLAMTAMACVLLFSYFEKNVYSFAVASELLSFGEHDSIVLNNTGTNLTALVLPFLAALPYTTAYIDECKSGYIKMYISRISVNRYVVAKVLACALSGGLVIMLGAVVSYILLALMLLPIEAAPTIVSGADKVKSLSPIWGKFALLFASGCFWSMVGLMLASVTKSRYMAYIGPFVVCYILIILYERYFDFLYVIYPREWLNPSDKWVLGAWGVAILLIVLTGVIGCIFAYWARRQLVQE